MAEDLSLPTLAWGSTSESILGHRPRKRARLSPPAFSSDPPLFSSDDDPSAENYTQFRQKKLFRGPWYEQHPTSDSSRQDSQERDLKKPKRHFERQFDSGVWMGSDGTDMDEAIEGMEIDCSITTKLPFRSSQKAPENILPSPEELAQKQIERCLEEGTEVIELSSRDLISLSNATIRPLAAFTRVPPVVEGVFARIEPNLKIFLGQNRLSTLPGELFNLHNLTVLSVRGNQIHELPPAIGRLRSLTELNIIQNGLQYLPYEILDLFSAGSRLQSFIIHPNPFHEPQYPNDAEDMSIPEEEEVKFKIGLGNRIRTRPRRGAICGISPDRRQRTWNPKWRISYKARTEVRYLDNNGAHLKGPTLSNHTLFGPRKFPNGIPIANENDDPKPPLFRGVAISRVPSLLETALNACSKTTELPFLISQLPEESPEYFPTLLATVAAKKESGGSKCTICKRNFIIPRTEWIEWWEIMKADDGKRGMASAASPLRVMENERDAVERMVPLMRRGCSWLCVPEKVVKKEERDGGEGMDVDVEYAQGARVDFDILASNP